MCNYKKILSFLLIIVFILSQITVSINAQTNISIIESLPNFKIDTPSAILIDAKTGDILYEKNSETKMYPASITKIMTAILGIESGDLNRTVTMSKNAVMSLEPGSSNAGLVEGEELTMENLLYSLLLWSANESANGIAEEVSGSTEDFAKLMTKKAKEIGAKNTNFVNANGLHNDNHYTTAHDMAMIAKYAMTIPKFREIVSTVQYQLPSTNKNQNKKELVNGNKLIRSDSKYYYENAIGIKTGYTVKAGPTLVSSAKKDGMELIAVVLNSPIDGLDYYSFIDSKKLFEYGFENFHNVSILDKNVTIDEVKVKGSRTKLKPFYKNQLELMLPKSVNKNDIIANLHIDEISVPIKKNQKIGSAKFLYKNFEIASVDILSDKEIVKRSFSSIASEKFSVLLKYILIGLKYLFYLVLVLFLIFIILTIIHNKKRKNKKRKRRKLK